MKKFALTPALSPEEREFSRTAIDVLLATARRLSSVADSTH